VPVLGQKGQALSVVAARSVPLRTGSGLLIGSVSTRGSAELAQLAEFTPNRAQILLSFAPAQRARAEPAPLQGPVDAHGIDHAEQLRHRRHTDLTDQMICNFARIRVGLEGGFEHFSKLQNLSIGYARTGGRRRWDARIGPLSGRAGCR